MEAGTDGETSSERRLEVRPSLIPDAGKGLFAAQFIAAGAAVCRYEGELLNTTQAIRLEDKAYLMRLGPQVYVDALRNEDCLARYLNDCRHKCGYNVRFDKKPEEGCADVVAIRDVYPGEELYVDYGRWYWAGGDGSSLPLRDMLWRQMQCKEQYLQERQSPEAEDAEGTVR